MNLVHKGWVMHRHQTERLCQSWVRSRFANQVVMEYSPIKCLVLRPNGREKLIGAKVFARHTGDAHCRIRQRSKEPGKGLVRDETGRIDDDFAGVELRLQVIGKDFERSKVGIFLRGHVNADRTRQLAVDVEPE